jgi:TctA family transporter
LDEKIRIQGVAAGFGFMPGSMVEVNMRKSLIMSEGSFIIFIAVLKN